jgi:hypothetical protein
MKNEYLAQTLPVVVICRTEFVSILYILKCFVFQSNSVKKN